MIETYTHRGLWWTPSDPDDKLNGTLTVTNGDPSLDVVGNFGHEVISESKGERVYAMSLADQDRVLGMTTDGRSVTLVGCTEVSGNTRMPGIATAVYRARAAIFGHMFENDDPIEFDEIEIRTSELERWIGYVPFPVERLNAETDPALANVRVTRPRPIEIPLANGQHAQMRFEIQISGLGVVTTDASLRYAAWIGLRFTEGRELADASRAVWQLRNFLSLAIGKPLAVLAVDGYRDDLVDKQGHRTALQLLYPITHNAEQSTRTVQPWEMLFTFAEARDRLPEVLGAWLAHHDLLEPVFALYFGTLYNPNLYLEQRFIAYAQAIETYDRRRRPGAKERSPADHKALIGEIFDTVPKEHRKWLKEKLAWSNDLALGQRIEHVLSASPNVTARIVGAEGLGAFVRAVKNTRNYYTHYDPAGKSKAATEPRDLYRLTVQLRAVLETAFLLELDFECTDIETVLQRARRFEEIDITSSAQQGDPGVEMDGKGTRNQARGR